jgi:PAS domain S-box-containing protein
MNASYRLFSRVSSLLVVSVALIVFIGWQFDQPALTNFMPEAPAIPPLTALLLFFLGTSLFLLNHKTSEIEMAKSLWLKRAVWLLAGTAVLLGLFTAAQYLFTLPPSLELWLYPAAGQQVQTEFPGRPSLHTAVSGSLSGLAIILAASHRPAAQRFLAPFVLASILIVWIVLFGYITVNDQFYGLQSSLQIGMSPVTGVSYLIIAFGILAWQPDQRALKKLEVEEEKFRTLLESAPDALVIVNEAGQIAIVNKQTEKLFQFQREELINQPIEILLPERFKATHPHQRRDFFARPYTRPMHAGLELYGRRRDGHEFPVEVSLNNLKNPEGNLALATIRDVTEQKLAAETLRQFNSQLEERTRQVTAELRERNEQIEQTNAELQRHAEALEQSNLELQQFAYIASHDLQTPLRSISGFVQLLQQRYQNQLDEQANEWINITVENTIRMQTLIRDILAYSRVESPAHPFEPVDLNEVFHEVCALLKHELKDRSGGISVDGLPTVMGNRTQLTLLMQNLIGNGIKYNDNPLPGVHVSAKPNDDEWIIAVQDNGIGINPDHFSKIFEIFRRLHTQDEYPGNGIGLAICRRVVERHGGKMWVKSEPDQGSTFYFSLPKRGGTDGTTA